jgi:LEA14-like dessication related protein
MACPVGITDDDERKIWEVKSEALFDIFLTNVKPAIRQIIKVRINEDDKSVIEFWIAMETKYRIHAADTRIEFMRRFITAAIEGNNV